jgi:hypothetical protein
LATCWSCGLLTWMVGRDEDEAALRDLMDSALREILTSIAGCDEKEA